MQINIDFVINIINSEWEPGKTILDVGCGPAFLRSVFGKDYIGTDITDENYSDEFTRDVDIVCSAENLLCADRSIDIVMIKSAFFLFTDKNKVLQEGLRVLKPGGKVFLFDYNKKTQKMLQQKAGHSNYPCWTQWGLRKLVKDMGFKNLKLWIAQDQQPSGLKKYYHLLRQEIRGTWAIVSATKDIA